jgi:hypothetical protein
VRRVDDRDVGPVLEVQVEPVERLAAHGAGVEPHAFRPSGQLERGAVVPDLEEPGTLDRDEIGLAGVGLDQVAGGGAALLVDGRALRDGRHGDRRRDADGDDDGNARHRCSFGEMWGGAATLPSTCYHAATASLPPRRWMVVYTNSGVRNF